MCFLKHVVPAKVLGAQLLHNVVVSPKVIIIETWGGGAYRMDAE